MNGLAPDDLGGTDPAEAFALLGDETRIHILEELWAAPEEPVSFTELRERVGLRDSAQFNYHLDRLVGTFVRKTEEGYAFKYAGEKVVRAILAGTFTEDVTLDFRLPGECHDCGADLAGHYADEHLEVACTECEATYGEYPFPPGGLRDRTPAEVAEAFNQRVRHLHCLAADGVCPECGGRMDTRIVGDETNRVGTSVRVDHECERCQHRICSPVAIGLLDDARVVSFHEEHGVDLPGVPYWTLEWVVSDDALTVESRDPWRLRVEIDLGETLSVRLDQDLAVVDVERRAPRETV